MSNYPIAVPQHLKANRPKFIVKFSSWVLNSRQWEIDGAIPEDKRVVLVIGPHTSNWDFIIGVLVILSLDAKINWIGKHTIFKRGFKGLLTRLGGIPVNRQDPSELFSKIKAITENPAKIFGINAGSLEKGMPADIAVIDLEKPWLVKRDQIQSKSKNTAIENRKLQGKVKMTLLQGEVVYSN